MVVAILVLHFFLFKNEIHEICFYYSHYVNSVWLWSQNVKVNYFSNSTELMLKADCSSVQLSFYAQYIYIYIDFLQHMKDKNAIYFGNSAHLQHQQVLNQISICQLLVCLPSIQVIQYWVRGDSRTRPALTRCLSRFHSYILSLITPGELWQTWLQPFSLWWQGRFKSLKINLGCNSALHTERCDKVDKIYVDWNTSTLSVGIIGRQIYDWTAHPLLLQLFFQDMWTKTK